jgi:hypothetical protein
MLRVLSASRTRSRRTPADEPLATYLADHLAGADAALALIRRLARHHAGADLARGLIALETDVRADQRVLQAIRARITQAPPVVPRSGGWLAERMLRLKLPLDASHRALSLFEGFELLAIGIWGKRALWIMLGRIAAADERFSGVDFRALERRAVQQYDQVERQRIAAGLTALSRAVAPRLAAGTSG